MRKIPKIRLSSAAAAALALALVAPSIASAQPGGGPPPPPPATGPSGSGYYGQPASGQAAFFDRRGMTLGFSLGVGGMASDSGTIETCSNCDYEPAAISFDGYLGGMVNSRLALMAEVWGTGQSVEASGATTLMQVMVMGVAKYWLTPQLWIKGGLGVSNLSYSIDTGSEVLTEDIDAGGALMGAIGYEIMSSRRFALDLQLKAGTATYDRIGDQVSSGALSVGFTWF